MLPLLSIFICVSPSVSPVSNIHRYSSQPCSSLHSAHKFQFAADNSITHNFLLVVVVVVVDAHSCCLHLPRTNPSYAANVLLLYCAPWTLTPPPIPCHSPAAAPLSFWPPAHPPCDTCQVGYGRMQVLPRGGCLGKDPRPVHVWTPSCSTVTVNAVSSRIRVAYRLCPNKCA